MGTKKLHYFSGVTISLFVAVHLLNHFYSLFGANAHIELMDSFRVIYRNIVTESMLFIAVFIQILSGARLFAKKRKTASGFFSKLQIWTGLYLAFFLLVHLTAVLVGRFLLNLDTNFYFGVAGINTFPLNFFFIPYYGFAIISFFGHVSAIHSKKMKQSFVGVNPYNQAYGILILGILLTIIIFYGLTNGFNGVEIPKEYHIMIGK